MAIPGFQQYYNMTYDESVYYNYISYMVGIVADKYTDVVSIIEELRQTLIKYKAPNLLLANGYVDVWKIKSPTVEDILSRNMVIVDYGENSGSVASGFVDGAFHIFFNQAADDYVKQISIPIPQQLISPILYISKASGVVPGDQPALPSQPYVFVATFITRWGETQPSNVVRAWTVDDSQSWEVTLEVEEDYIPSYASSVKYYRWFTDKFRVVAEVKI